PSSSAARRISSRRTTLRRERVLRRALACFSQNFMPWSAVSIGPASSPPMSAGLSLLIAEGLCREFVVLAALDSPLQVDAGAGGLAVPGLLLESARQG